LDDVVEVVEGAVVDVVEDEVVDEVVDDEAVVDVDVVDVDVVEDAPAVVVVVVDDAPVDSSRRAVTMVPFGLGNVVPDGTNPMVMSWSFSNFRVEGLPLTTDPFPLEAKAFFQ
jgi:hypothetical protein